MILAIDTSSARSALALILPDGTVAHDELSDSRIDLAQHFRALGGHRLTKVAVAIGPGSFTGTRVGVSFAVGLAMGLKIPVVPLPSLALQAARADEPVLALSEAGRGRVYHLAPGQEAGLAEPSELPKDWPAVGWLRPNTSQSVLAAGIQMKDESELRSFGSAAARLLKSAREVPYGSVKLEYMQSMGARF